MFIETIKVCQLLFCLRSICVNQLEVVFKHQNNFQRIYMIPIKYFNSPTCKVLHLQLNF